MRFCASSDLACTLLILWNLEPCSGEVTSACASPFGACPLAGRVQGELGGQGMRRAPARWADGRCLAILGWQSVLLTTRGLSREGSQPRLACPGGAESAWDEEIAALPLCVMVLLDD